MRGNWKIFGGNLSIIGAEWSGVEWGDSDRRLLFSLGAWVLDDGG